VIELPTSPSAQASNPHSFPEVSHYEFWAFGEIGLAIALPRKLSDRSTRFGVSNAGYMWYLSIAKI